MLRVVRTAFMLTAVAGVGCLAMLPLSAFAGEQFMSHAHFDALHSHIRQSADPQVFVADANAPAVTSTQGASHIAGYRPARPDDNPSLPLYNSQGTDLSLSLGRWFDASGTAKFLPALGNGNVQVSFAFTNLVPFGVYSLFVSRSTPDGTLISLFSDATTTMKASIDGYIALTAVSAVPLTDGDSLLLVYHSDGIAHGQDRGELGITAHEQLLLPVLLAHEGQQAGAQSPATAEQPLDDAQPPSNAQLNAAPSAIVTPPAVPSAEPSARPTILKDENDDDIYVPPNDRHAATPKPSPMASADDITPSPSSIPVTSPTPTDGDPTF